jgi:hypothetical protein
MSARVYVGNNKIVAILERTQNYSFKLLNHAVLHNFAAQIYKKNAKIFAKLKKGCTFAFALAPKPRLETLKRGSGIKAHSSIG